MQPTTTTTTAKLASQVLPKPNDDITITTEFRSPTKLNSILLTPGTGTARRKRVSFGGDVKTSASAEPSPFEVNKSGRRRNTALQQALENSRKNKKLTEQPSPEKESEKLAEFDAGWEGDEIFCNHDVTVDLNEPHSGSGKYWKSEFDRYHEDAKAEMTALVKYKHLAKSYAKQKDLESVQLARQLREEQDKVAALEKKLEAVGGAATEGQARGSKERDQSALVKELSKQTELVMEYRDRIRDLEATLRDRVGDNDSGRRAGQTSPRDEQNLLEVSRELRRVKSELKQVDSLKAENERLKAALGAAKEQITKTTSETSSEGALERARTRELGNQVRDLKEELRKEKSESRKTKREYETLKNDAKKRTVEAMQVLQEKNDKIAQLEEDLRAARKEREAGRQQRELDRVLAEHHKITHDLEANMNRRKQGSSETQTAVPRRLQKSVSADDFTLDFTAQMDQTPCTSRSRAKADEYGKPAVDMSPSRPRQNGRSRAFGDGKDMTEDDWTMPRAGQTQPTAKIRAVESAQVLTDLPNENASKTRAATSRDLPSDKYRQGRYHSTLAETGKSVANSRNTSDAARAAKPDDVHSRKPVPSYEEDEGIDLLKNRFVALGHGSPSKPGIGNTSRCTLPPDRLAAARARLQQKKLDRMRPTGHRIQEIEKENYEP